VQGVLSEALPVQTGRIRRTDSGQLDELGRIQERESM
jgi:hypothetical protein